MAAMACGKGAREAVAIACKYDIYSKPPIHVVTLGKKPKIIKKKNNLTLRTNRSTLLRQLEIRHGSLYT